MSFRYLPRVPRLGIGRSAVGSLAERPAASLAYAAFLLGLAMALCPPGVAHADDKSGVAPNRLKLPKGPGSLEGVGENVTPELSMGLMAYGIPIDLPAGYNGHTPSLRLSYSSGGAVSVVGFGWSLSVPSIERMTSKGLPNYSPDDLVAAGGGDELVAVSTAPDRTVYRARYESGFVRYTWFNPRPDGGRRSHWLAEYPDGKRAWFGATAEGAAVGQSRVEGPVGTFAWRVVEMQDTLGHRIVYGWDRNGSGHPYLRTIDWVERPNGEFRYRVRVDYEDRLDEVTDGKPGFLLQQDRRVREITVLHDGRRTRSWRLGYDSRSGISRLVTVDRYGAVGRTPFPIRFGFEYTGALGEAGDRSVPPYIAQAQGNVGPGFGQGKADFFDINSDGLPDVLYTPGDGPHQFSINAGARPDDPDAVVTFAPLHPSEIDGIGSVTLDRPEVQPADVDGDGDTDLLIGGGAGAGYLRNEGSGDWAEEGLVPVDALNLPSFESDGPNLRFFDYDGDRRMDVLLAIEGGSTSIYANVEGPGGERVFGDGDEGATTQLGVGFNQGLQLADMNGDGLLDAAQQFEAVVRYRANLGNGAFSQAWIPMDGLPGRLPAGTRLADLNGDSLSDLVWIAPGEVQVWLNRNGRVFDDALVIGGFDGVEVARIGAADIPERPYEMQIRFADLNGNGSTDIIWIDSGGDVTYLELFPVRPNLLVGIDNGIGATTRLTYGDSTQHMLRAAQSATPWTTHLPNPTQTLDRIESTVASEREGWAPLELQEFEYADGYYDGEERQFRGFQRVVARTAGDATAGTLQTENHFDVGAPGGDRGENDSYFKGLPIEKHAYEVLGPGAYREFEATYQTYGDCGDLVEVPEHTREPIRFICQTGTRRVVFEGLAAREAVATEESYVYDGLGNRTRTTKHGVVSHGDESGCADACGDPSVFGAPCGPNCLGDELTEETTFVSPADTAGRWMLRSPCDKRTYGREGSRLQTRERTYYDDLDAHCSLTTGLVTRSTAEVTPGSPETIETVRNVYDDEGHGNVVEAYDANGNARRFAYDADGLLPTTETVVIDSAEPPYDLTMMVTYDGLLDLVVQSSDWRVVRGGAPVSPEYLTTYDFDEFGRLTSMTYPDDDGVPSEHYAYEIAAPTPRIIKHVRSGRNTGDDIEEIQCFDGRGRSRGKVGRIEAGRYLVTELTRLNAIGKASETYQPFETPSGGCPLPGDVVLASTTHYDALGRPTEVIHPDAADFGGTASRTHTDYAPLVTASFDENDTDSANARDTQTPSTTRVDGLGRTVLLTRIADRDAAGPIPLTLTYDELGRLRGYIDAEGNEKVQTYDLLGRVTRVDDPDTGVTTFEYDPAGNLLRSEDARGAVTRSEYDAANRAIAAWREWPESGEDRASTVVTTDYDLTEHCAELGRVCTHAAGRLVRTAFPIFGLDGETGFDELGYDARGRASVRLRGLARHRFRFESTYDNAGRITSATYPDGDTFHVRYDALGRVVGVDDHVTNVEYDHRGVLVEARLFNGLVETHDYDRRLREVAYGVAGGQGAVTSRRLTRDRVGNLLGVDDLIEPALGAPSGDATYEHDSLYRLKTAAMDPGRAGAAETLTWVYDNLDRIRSAASDRVASPAHVGTYDYGAAGDQPNAVKSTQAGNVVTNYTYDAAGFMGMNGPAQYQWDAAGRLLTVQRNGTEALRAGYGPGSDRVVKRDAAHLTWYPDPSFEVRDGVTTKYVSVGSRKVVKIERTDAMHLWLSDLAPVRAGPAGMLAPAPDDRINAADAWVAQRAETGDADFVAAGHGADDVEVLLSAAARRMVDAAEERRTGLHHDHLGSVVASTDSSGAVVARVEHYPYGLVRWQSDSAGEDYEYTGKEHDDAAGLTYFGARYLDARLGRWVSADPVLRVLDLQFLSGGADSPPATLAQDSGEGDDCAKSTPRLSETGEPTAKHLCSNQWRESDTPERGASLNGTGDMLTVSLLEEDAGAELTARYALSRCRPVDRHDPNGLWSKGDAKNFAGDAALAILGAALILSPLGNIVVAAGIVVEAYAAYKVYQHIEEADAPETKVIHAGLEGSE